MSESSEKKKGCGEKGGMFEPDWPGVHIPVARDERGLSDSRVGLSTETTTSALGKGSGGRLRFAADELAIVMSHYDVGAIEAIQEYAKGSRKAPKALIRTGEGLYLLKRRAKGKDDPFKVAFCHSLQLHLTDRQFPLPHLIGTRDENNSLLQCGGHVYELFEYISGTQYDFTLNATYEGGKILGLYHKLTRNFESEYEPAEGSYHNASSVKKAFELIPKAIARLDEHKTKERLEEAKRLTWGCQMAYMQAASKVDELGLNSWPMQVVHSDWHPGNMLYRGSQIIAVIDYDAARVQQRILDTANGGLQFAILGGGEDPAEWPAHLDEARLNRFMSGYEQVEGGMLSKAEIACVPWLMIEALIAESVLPIAATGRFSRMDGVGFLQMVERKVKWLEANAERLVGNLSA